MGPWLNSLHGLVKTTNPQRKKGKTETLLFVTAQRIRKCKESFVDNSVVWEIFNTDIFGGIDNIVEKENRQEKTRIDPCVTPSPIF